MANNRTQANTLFSAEEMMLFDASLADRLKALGAAELRKQVKRAHPAREIERPAATPENRYARAHRHQARAGRRCQ